ncbi:hypothetical protein [Pseudomonas chlororaphis]|uniref:hypothetical protein n=1 Tax=Pseudomonas chlororaphis TaxID=587753 RepID=UPI000F583134|nr:hypothetical protein [Pseudomonas chlororaphis]
MLKILKPYSHVIGFVLLVVAVVGGVIRFDGSWHRFFSMVLAQLWFGQAVYNYLRGGRVTIGPGGMSPDADPVLRGSLAAFALFVYIIVFFLF